MKFKKTMLSVMEAFGLSGGFSIKQYQRDMANAKNRILEGSQVVKTTQGFIEYSTFGNGIPALFIHGAGGGHDMGRLFARMIGEDFYWICPSRFGYLRTPIPEDPSFESQADAYAALLDYLHIEKAAIIGLSIGGPSALLFAMRHPKRCAALVLTSAISKTTLKRPKADWFYNTIFSSDFIYWVVSHTAKNILVKKFGVDPSVLKSLTKNEKNGQKKRCIYFIPQAEDIQEY